MTMEVDLSGDRFDKIDTDGELTEHVDLKVKKHRRGKKFRKAKPYDEMQAESWNGDNTLFDNDEANNNTINRPLQRGGGLRPRYSPQAPRNYTQYLIDDQLARMSDNEKQLGSFLASQFEVELKQHQEAELTAKSRSELQSLVNDLRNQVSTLESRLFSCSTCKATHIDSQTSDDADINSSINSDSDTEKNTITKVCQNSQVQTMKETTGLLPTTV